jgi:protein-disulfide isomerase
MHRWVLAAAALAGAAGLSACDRHHRRVEADGPAYRQQVVDYLVKHPDVIEEAASRYEAQQQATERAAMMATAQRMIPLRRAAIEHDPRDEVANPGGKVTVVEFFDYRCPYCKAALPSLDKLIADNKDVRFVFKQMPILPDADGRIGVSLRAARAAMAAGRQGRFLPVHDALMSQKALDDEGIARALKANGLDPAAAEAPAPAVDQDLQDTRNLAVAIGATGTPTFVVGDTLVPGNSMGELAAAIDKARRGLAKG